MILEQIYLWVKSIKSISLYPGIYNEKKEIIVKLNTVRNSW